MDIEQLMERFSRSGVTMILKTDHERMEEGREPWTMVLMGPGLGEGSGIRAESSSLDDCFAQVFGRLRERGGDWAWLKEFESA